MSRLRSTGLVAVVGLVGILIPAGVITASSKLCLKDGTYQVVKSYEVRGDRVRYYSVERSDWEEVPVSLVDFDATKRVQQQDQGHQANALDQAKELEHQRFEAIAPTAGFEVSPGFHLPAEDGVYAFDGLRVVTMIQSIGQIVNDKKRLAASIALPVPLLKGRSLVQLDGPRAAVRLMSLQPTFYIRSPNNWGAKAELIPVKSTKEARVVEKIQSGIGVGKSGELHHPIPLEREQIASGLYKVKPAQPLEVGEYALGEIVQDEKLNIDVWDFGVDGRPGALPPTGDIGQAPMTEQAPEGQSPAPHPRVRGAEDPNLPRPDQQSPPLPIPNSSPSGSSSPQ